MTALSLPVAPALRLRPGAHLRRLLWRLVLTLTGGLRVTGSLPDGPCVVVADHGSHADTAALLAALPAGRRPVAAAAADYWFGVRWRRLLVQSLAAALPVARGRAGAYAALRAAAAPVLAAGDVVVVFPEGTRSADGEVGRFRSGALRLAADCGVPVVPVALVGTRELLPKHGRVRPRPVEVRIGAALHPGELTVDADGAAALRDRVLALRVGPARAPVSPAWRWVSRRATARSLLPLSFLVGAAEALSWPVLAEVQLALWVACVPRRVLPAALALTAGSVAGVVVHVLLVRHGIAPPLPLTTPRMLETAARQLADEGAPALLHQPLSIPVKVYAAQAADVPLLPLALWTAAARGARILAVGLAVRLLAGRLAPLLRRLYGAYLAVVVTAVAVGLHLVVSRWS